jgi:uncharacterized damage-inducible protein DinB
MAFYGAKELAEAYRTVRKNTIQIAEDIPADKYTFKAAPEVKSVAEVLAHIVVAAGWHIEFHGNHVSEIDFASFAEGLAQAQAEEQALAAASKEEIVKTLRERGEAFASFLDGLTDATLAERVSIPMPGNPLSKTRFEMLLGAKEHEMHHRGQLMLVERIIGIVPHLTKQREAMTAQMQGQAAATR